MFEQHETALPLSGGGEAGEDDVEVDGLHLIGPVLDRPPQRVARRLPVALALLPQQYRAQLVRVHVLERRLPLRGAVAARLVRAQHAPAGRRHRAEHRDPEDHAAGELSLRPRAERVLAADELGEAPADEKRSSCDYRSERRCYLSPSSSASLAPDQQLFITEREPTSTVEGESE